MNKLAMVMLADKLRPNTIESEIKLRWLEELDGRIYGEILSSHEGYENFEIPKTELIAPAPYDEMYIYWLFMKMDYMNGETERFNNDALMHNTAWLNYANHINRTCMPRTNGAVTCA